MILDSNKLGYCKIQEVIVTCDESLLRVWLYNMMNVHRRNFDDFDESR